MVWMKNVSHRPGYLNIQTPASGIVWGGSDTSSPAGERTSAGGRLWESIVSSKFRLILSSLCLHLKMWSLGFLLWPPVAMTPLTLWTAFLEPQAEINSSLCYLSHGWPAHTWAERRKASISSRRHASSRNLWVPSISLFYFVVLGGCKHVSQELRLDDKLVVRQNGIPPVSPEELCRLSTVKPLLIGWCMSHPNYYIPSPLGVRLCRHRGQANLRQGMPS